MLPVSPSTGVSDLQAQGRPRGRFSMRYIDKLWSSWPQGQ